MKSRSKTNILLLLLSVILSSCVNNLIIHDTQISGPTAKIPHNFVTENDSTIIDASIGVTHNNDRVIIGKSSKEIENSQWSISNTNFSGNVDIRLKEKISAFIGYDYSQIDNKSSNNLTMGIGIWQIINGIATRLDAGTRLSQMHHISDVSYNVERMDGGERWIREITSGSSYNSSYFASISSNTLFKDFPINPYLRFAYSYHNIAVINLLSDDASLESGTIRVSTFVGSVGAAINITKQLYVLAGLDYNILYAPKYYNTEHIAMPFFRIHYQLKPPSIFNI